jgi:hypothetical protein
MQKDVSEYTKDQLADYVASGVDFPAPEAPLNMKKSVETLRSEVVEMQKQAVATHEEPTESFGYMKNLETGFVFPFTHEGFEHLSGKVARCDKDGNY